MRNARKTEASMRGTFTMRVQAVLVAIALFFSFDLSFGQTKKLRPLHIALANHSVSMTAIYVAKHLGIFEGYGYDARILVLEPRAGIGALLSGDLDCYFSIGLDTPGGGGRGGAR